MKFKISAEVIPQNKREEVNNKILLLIESGQAKQIPAEAIFNGYTGTGGLHGLDRDEYDSYYQFSSAKKEIENGQFFTPARLAEKITECVPVQITDLVGDLTCGAGVFFNSMPVEANCYGCELDVNASKVARFLYPSANIETQDIRFYNPPLQLDVVLLNPPFNLSWKIDGTDYLSQGYVMQKSFEVLAPGGLLAMVTPSSFLNDDFMAKYWIEKINGWFGFLGQCNLPKNSFAPFGVKSYSTKVMFFQKRFDGIPAREYKHDEFLPFNPQKIKEEIILPALQHKKAKANEIRLSQATGENDWSFKLPELRKADGYKFQLKKYLFEIRKHPELKSKLGKALAFINRFETQKHPENMSSEEWEKIRLTEDKVVAYLRRLVKSQGKTRKEGYSIFNDRSGIRIKAHDAGTSKRFSEKHIRDISWMDIIADEDLLKKHLLASELRRFANLAARKREHYFRNFRPLGFSKPEATLVRFIEQFAFITPKNEVSYLTDIQREDTQKILGHDYGILSWEQGSGKTIASWCAIQYRLKYSGVKNVFVIAPPIATKATWSPFLSRQNANFTVINKVEDIANIKEGQVVVCALTTLIKLQRFVRKYLKQVSNNALLVFDESDEITNYHSSRSQAVRNVFRRSKYKLLTTGTTTRNNIAEIYGQLELLYNNSNLFICHCPEVYREQIWKDRDGITHKDIAEQSNEKYGEAFPPRGGWQLFKSCFAPAKSTVFGIKKHNQDVYNADALKSLIERTIITRKFKEIAGPDRFAIHSHKLVSKPFEQALYDKILDELNSILPTYYRSTGNARKDAMLRIIRQLQLLIKSCSIPHLMERVSEVPAKAPYILKMITDYQDEKIIVGCTTVAAARFYAEFLRNKLGDNRIVYFVSGKTHDIAARQAVVDQFEKDEDSILVCTQQSLSSSINIPTCSRVILESLQWNIPRISQFYCRTIRFDSIRKTNIHFVLYQNSIEVNLMALLTAKERLNDYIKTLELRDRNTVMEDFGLDSSFLDFLLERITDPDGKVRVQWGKQVVC